ncbi:MAG: EamA family transporter, partial [Campylobacterales bacterium]|nr:EamA family transporter [Campylobacterales bacterium]
TFLVSNPILFAKFVMPSFHDFILIIFLAIFATISQLLMTKAYFYEKAGIVGTIGYSNILFSFFIGLILGDNFLEIGTICGIILIVFSGIGVAKEKDIKG